MNAIYYQVTLCALGVMLAAAGCVPPVDGGNDNGIPNANDNADGNVNDNRNDNDNGVVIDDRQSSRKHCEVRLSEIGYVVNDLKSRNGTLLNQDPIDRPIPLQNGDEIGLSAGGYEVFVAVDAIADDLAGSVGYGLGLGLDSGDVAAGIRLRDRIGDQRLTGSDLAKPFLLLLLGSPLQQPHAVQPYMHRHDDP